MAKDGGLKCGEIKILVSVIPKVWLVLDNYNIQGDIFKLRGNLVKSIILSYLQKCSDG
jgi:hypothetical protein